MSADRYELPDPLCDHARKGQVRETPVHVPDRLPEPSLFGDPV